MKQFTNTSDNTITNRLNTAVNSACAKIAPLWPLENVVAVNPYLGFGKQNFRDSSVELAATGGIKSTMPLGFYLTKIKSGEISQQDLKFSLEKHNNPMSVSELTHYIENNNEQAHNPKLRSFTDLVSERTGIDWKRIMIEHVSAWAASHFDKGQAIWQASFNYPIYRSWKAEAEIDRSMDILGLLEYRTSIRSFSNDHITALTEGLAELQISESSYLELYFQRLLRTVNGWSSYIAYLDWEEKLKANDSEHLVQFLAILVNWEVALFRSQKDKETYDAWIKSWNETQAASDLENIEKELSINFILQDAFDRAEQKHLLNKLNTSRPVKMESNTLAQAVFCIDVRSEVYRKNLEKDPRFKTLGFAGFFGFPINYQPIGSHEMEAQCPILLHPPYNIKESLPKHLESIVETERKDEAAYSKALKAFRSGAVSCFSFVSPLGLSYLPKLISNSLGNGKVVKSTHKIGLDASELSKSTVQLHKELEFGISLSERIELAKNALKAMSLTKDFSPYVMLVGHGSSSTNNPHATGYDCGACGGHTGEANAKVAARTFNDPEVRKGLKQHGIEIPDETIFLACLHNTTTDELTIFENGLDLSVNSKDIDSIQKALDKASKLTRAKRAERMNISKDLDRSIVNRSKDWAQTRPEWGLAGCSAFIIAPRRTTQHLDLESRSFLHSYEWKQDKEFAVLEQIMTAPMIVTNWINLQYYGSTVDNTNLGSGNKTLHNITSGIGVIEGASGDIRVGLPQQSVHDGDQYQHQPNRLSVIINAPESAIQSILNKHPEVKDLFDNEWMYLFSMNDEGIVTKRYSKETSWQEA